MIGVGDYLLDAKGNQPAPEEEIRDYIQDDNLRKEMDYAKTREKNRDRQEKRTAYVTTDISWMAERKKWKTCPVSGL